MANTSSARKCARKSERHRQHNIALVSRFRTAVKNVVKAIEKGDKAAAVEAYKRAVPVEKALHILSLEVKDGHIDGDLVRIFNEARVWEPVMGVPH